LPAPVLKGPGRPVVETLAGPLAGSGPLCAGRVNDGYDFVGGGVVLGAKGGPLELRREVMDSGMCTGCGICVELCPYIKTIGERVAFIHQCTLDDGNCYRSCPRTPTDWGQLDRAVFGREREDFILGIHTEVLFARAADEEVAVRGQYGGVVSALVAFLLTRGEVAGAVLTGGPAGEIPGPVVARTREEVLACAGSHYSASPTLAGLNRAVRQGLENLAVVGRPCQVLALRKMQGLPGVLAAHKVDFVIGLFCFWSLDTAIYKFMAARAGAPIERVDIPPEVMALTTGSGVVNIPVDEVRRFIRPVCLSCFDPTAEFADVSVGSTEHDPAWNTLIVRSGRGRAAVDAARAAGAIETKAYPGDRLPILRKAVRDKKLRVLEDIEKRGRSYLEPSTAYAGALREERGDGE